MKRLLAAFAALTLTLTLSLAAASPAMAADDQERQIGAQFYQQLLQKGEIIQSSPWYRILNPLASRIARVADPQYDYPFHFILVHEAAPNAFAVPGGNVYVTDALMKFVQNQQELAGVLCHETSHDIHHDVINLARKDQNLGIAATIGSLILGGGNSAIINNVIGITANLQALNYNRGVESAADAKGAYTCAQAGFNPWGMVWLFQNFEKADTGGHMEMLSDHPTDSHRVEDLEHLFASQPQIYGRFSNNMATATAMPTYQSLARYGSAGPLPGYETAAQ